MSPTLERVASPADLRELTDAQLDALATEIRAFLVQKVASAGSGHLGPNLGVVELTIALHRVFDSPAEPILFDTGHQSYVHKILTGRREAFDTLRSAGGLSGYPSRAESEHDWIENSHASTALSYADGMAKAFALREVHRPVVAVVGDGALTGGMCWEALNNIAAAERPVVIVVNDNGRSYSPTIGGVASKLNALRLRPGYERALGTLKRRLPAVPLVGTPVYGALHGMKRGVKDLLTPQGLFEDLGLKYLGPVDGHDRPAMERALALARDFGGPVIVHCVTRKGYGYAPAENDEIEQMHAPGAFDPATGRKLSRSGKKWTGVFSEELVRHAGRRSDLVAITAAMCHPTGLAEFARVFPERFYDVGIAEQHALTSAAGLASGGLHPVVAVYSTFLNRAFDQLLMDVALHRLPVTVVLDRAGLTGDDGPSHNGMWDLAVLGVVPGLRMAAPRDATTLREELDEALAWDQGPSVLRFPKTVLPTDMPALRRVGCVDVLDEPGSAAEVDVLLVSVGACAADVLTAAQTLRQSGRSVRVVDPRWVGPLDPALLELAGRAALVVSVEDGVVVGGVGSRLAQAMGEQNLDVPARQIGIPAQFLAHGKIADVRAAVGLDAPSIAERVLSWCADGASGGASGADGIATA